MGERRHWLTRLDDNERAALAASAARRGGSPAAAVTVDQAIAAAIRHCFAKGHHLVPEKRLVAAALTEGLGTLTSEAIRYRLPLHGIAFRDYDGQRFCAWRAPYNRSDPGLTAWEQERRDFIRQRQRRLMNDQRLASRTPPPQPGWSHGR